MILIVLCLFGGGIWIYFAVQYEQKEVREAVARGEYEQKPADPMLVAEEDWRLIYPNTVPLKIGATDVEASISDDLPERIKGLSDTPFLPSNVVKLFVFGAYGNHAIWMKDMNYALDIIWLNKEGVIVHIEENVTPESFPKSFESREPAWYVVEANAGFVASSSVIVGDTVTLIK